MSLFIVIILPHTDVMFEFIDDIFALKILLLKNAPSENFIADISKI